MKRYNSSKSKKTAPSKEVIDYFPRGNTSKDDFGFNTAMLDHTSTFLSKKHKNKQSTSTSKEKTEQVIEKETTRVVLPRFKLGDLVLLSITEIRKDYMIANYNRNKKAMIHSSYSGLDSESPDFSFEKYFSIGQFISGAVVKGGNDIRLSNGHLNKKILVTINPLIVNTGIKPEKITEGMDIYGQLILNEKHEYAADFRLSGSDYKVNLIDQDNEILTDKIVNSFYYFKVVKAAFDKKNKCVNLDVSLNYDKYKFTVKTIGFETVRPGMLFKANVTRDLTNGKEITFGGNLGTIFVDHLKDETKTKNIYVRVIHVAVSKRTCSLSSLPHIRKLKVDDINDKEKLIGKKFSGKIEKILFGQSFIVSSQEGELKAFLHNNNIENPNEINVNDEIPSLYIKEYNFFDDMPICSTKDKSSKITWGTMKVGDYIEGEVKSKTANEIEVRVNDFITGKLPLSHICDHPLERIPAKFKAGTKIQARIFALEPQTKLLTLTMKETLMLESSQLFSSIHDLKTGDEIFVVYVGNKLFSHSNGVIGSLKEFKPNEFKIGKLYKFKIYHIDYNKKKIIFTKQNAILISGCGDFEGLLRRNIIIAGVAKFVNSSCEHGDKINEGDIQKFKICDINEICDILIKKGLDKTAIEENKASISEEILFAKLENDNQSYYVVLIKDLVSDFYQKENFAKIKDEKKEHEMLVLYHDKENKIMFVTMKKSLIENKDKILHLDETKSTIKEQNIVNDKIYYGYVNAITPKGVKVQFYGKKKILMRNYSELNKDYSQGQTVICKFINNKFYFDVKAYTTYTNEDFMNESEEYLNNLLFDKGIDLSKSKKQTKEIEAVIERIENGILISKYENNDLYISGTLYNYSPSVKDFKVGMTIKAKLIKHYFKSKLYIAHIPNDIITKIKSHFPSASSSRSIGDKITVKINGIKGNCAFSVIDKHCVCRIDLQNFNLNVEKITNLLSTNPQSDELRISAIIVNILSQNTKHNIKLYELAPVNEEEKQILSTELDLSGKKSNIGIISAVKPNSKHVLTLSIKSTQPINHKLNISFNDLNIDKISDNGIDYKAGAFIKFYTDDKFNCSLSPLPKKNNKIEIGSIYIARILKAISGRGLILDLNLNEKLETFVDITEITDFTVYNPLNFYSIGQIVKCRILSHDAEANRYFASLRSSIVSEEDYDIIKSGSTLAFEQRFAERSAYDLRNKILKYGNIAINVNDLAIGIITSSSEKGVFIKIANDVIVRVSLRELSDESQISKPYLLYKENQICLCRIISSYKTENGASTRYNASLRESVIQYPITMKKSQMKLHNFYNCFVMSENEKGFSVNIVGSTYKGILKKKNIKAGTKVEIMSIITAEICKMDADNLNGKIRFSTLNVDDSFDSQLIINSISKEQIEKAKENQSVYANIKEIIENAQKDSEMKELIDLNAEGKDNEIDFEEIVNIAAKNRKQSIESKNSAKIVDEENDDENEEEIVSEEENDNDMVITDQKEKIALLSGIGGKSEKENEVADVEMSDNSNEEGTKKKKTASQIIEKEMKIREMETKAENEEENAEYYEKLILSDKDNALNWIKYASYILDKLNLASSRKIFERAIKAIDITNKEQKMFLWVAYMNLENVYGNTETFKDIVERALEVNDKKKIYLHLINIYKVSKKNLLANETFKIVTKEFFNDIAVWKAYIEFLFESQVDDPKIALDKSMQVLNKKQHLPMTLHYAGCLYKFGKCEEARNLFDEVLKSLPKRKDIWFVYCDKETKYGNVDKARKIYERMIEVDFKRNALKSVMKKYLTFEKENSANDAQFKKAQSKAQKIIQERMEVDEDNDDEEIDEDGNDIEDKE